MTRYVIIGNGAAGVTAAETIRAHDAAGSITILSAETVPMYSRPGLAYVLTGEIPLRQTIARSADWYADQRIDLVYGRAERLDLDRRHVQLSDGRTVPYDQLLIATGARAVPAAVPGADLNGVVYLDTYAGTEELLRRTRRARRAVVVGGGITAMEMAEGLAARGVETHFFLRGDKLWSRVFSDAESAIVERHIRRHHVQLHFNTEIDAIMGNWRGRVHAVRLTDGSLFPCDLVGVAIGVRPQLDLAAGTRLGTDRGILVDETLATSVPGVYAAGDCAQVYDRWSDRHLVDILWPSAVAEGRAAGLNMAGVKTAYAKGVPFNAALLFGLHITAIGQVNPRPRDGDGLRQTQHWSRGSSDVWFTFPRHYRSAWSADGDRSLRLVLDGTRLNGALLIGNQRLADPLRAMVNAGVDAGELAPLLDRELDVLEEAVWQLWQRERDRLPAAV